MSPIMFVTNSFEVPRIGALYELGPLPAWLQPVSWPNEPKTTSSETVTTAAAFSSAISSGNHITVGASYSDSGTISIGSGISDLRITFEAGAVHTGAIANNGATRVMLEGPSVRPSGWEASKASITAPQIIGPVGSAAQHPVDYIVRNIAIDNNAGAGSLAFAGLTRFACVNTRMHGGNGVIITNADTASSDIIIAGNDWFCNGLENPFRLQDMTNFIVLENLVENGREVLPVKDVIRTNVNTSNWWVARNEMCGAGWDCRTFPAPSCIGPFGFSGNNWYIADGNLHQYINQGEDDWIDATPAPGHAVDETYYRDSSTGGWYPGATDADWTELSNNTYGGTDSTYPTDNPYW